MRKIVFDLSSTQGYKKVKVHGGGEYGKDFFRQLTSRELKREIIAVYDPRRALDNDLKRIIKSPKIIPYEIERLEDYTSIISKYDSKDNIFIFPLPVVPSFLFGNHINIERAKIITTIHGLRSLELPKDNYEYLYYFPDPTKMTIRLFKQLIPSKILEKRFSKLYSGVIQLLKTDDVILTDSFYSKYSIISHYKDIIKDFSILVLYPRVVINTTPNPSTEVRDITDNTNYILSVGANRYEKNILRVLDAIKKYSLFRKFLQGYKYIITGINPSFRKLIRRRYKSLVNNLVLFDYVSRDDLLHLYKNSKLFVYPSLNEGFGIPPIEAMGFGVPVMASATTSIPEVTGGIAEYFNPYSLADIQNRLLYLLNDEPRNLELQGNSKDHFKNINNQSKKQWEAFFSRFVE